MRRPATAREALGLSPLMHASRADASRLERVPLEGALAEPFVFFARRPAAERAANALAGGVAALVESGVAVDYGSGGKHARILWLESFVLPACSRLAAGVTVPVG